MSSTHVVNTIMSNLGSAFVHAQSISISVSLCYCLSQDASADIIVSHLSAAATAFSMTYEQDTLTFASGVVLDLAVPENRMFAVEISSYYAGLDSYVKQVAARTAGNKVSTVAGYNTSTT